MKKSERLVSALYLVTSFFDNKEPLKWKLRILASKLVSLEILIKDNTYKEREAVILRTRSVVSEITSLLSITKNVGLMSDTNHNLLNQEFSKYLDLLGLPNGMVENEGHLALSNNFFDVETKIVKEVENVENLEKKTVSIKDKTESAMSVAMNKGYLPIRHNPQKNRNLKKFGAVSIKKNSRQSTIISILKRKKEIMIKDVSSLINGCSEKTIQRELSSMVQSGIVKKVGEKRWSRYSLV